MTLKDTCKKMRALLDEIAYDMYKAEEGNKAAAQRVRKHTISFAKIAKVFRKESVRAGGSKRKATKRKAAPKRKSATKRKTTKRKAAPKRKTAAKKRPTTKKRTTTRKRK